MSSTQFERLVVRNWRQFDHIDLDLSSRLTVLTGVNGAGKTSLLALLGYHFSWSNQFVHSPNRRVREFTTQDARGELVRKRYAGSVSHIGTLTYDDYSESELSVPLNDDPQFSVSFGSQKNVNGLYLNSHRFLASYKPVSAIPARFGGASELFELFSNEVRSPFVGKQSKKSPQLVMKESLIAAAVFGEGSASVRPSENAFDIWNGFQDVLRVLLPKSFGFVRLVVDPPEVIVQTELGEFPLDALSGGLTAIFEIGWQIFLRSREFETFTVCFDEPENHLHPSLQREIMPNLLAAFPRVKFVVATHSPFVVTAARDARVYILDGGSRGLIEANELDINSDGVSAEQTLSNVLGVRSTLPIWAEHEFERILSNFSGSVPSAENLVNLRHQLENAGLSGSLPLAVDTVTSSRNRS